MEEKETIKVKLSTVLLIIASLVIIVMGVIIGIMYKQSITKENNVTNTENVILGENVNAINNNSNKEKSFSESEIEENDEDELDDKNENVTETTTTTTTSNTITDSNNNKTNNTIKYAEITNELEGKDVLYVTEVEKINGEYTLKGVIYTEYTLSKSELDNIVSKGKIKLNGKEYTLKKVENKEELIANSIYELSDGYTYIAKKENSNLYYLYSVTQISNVWKLTNNYRQIKVSGDLIVVDEYTDEKTTVKKEFNNLKNSQKAKYETNPSPAYKFEFKNGKCTEIIRATTII